MAGPDDGQGAGPDGEQGRAVAALVHRVLGDGVVGIYPHGSAVLGRLRRDSDLDVLVVAGRSTTHAERRALVDGLLEHGPGHGSGHGPGDGRRPVELTVVVVDDVRPWRYPPRREFGYGHRLREACRAGATPGPEPDPDLALLLAVARRGTARWAGPPVADVLDEVPGLDVARAQLDGLPRLLDGLAADTRNVLLTLARMWLTLATGEIRTKDAAAAWALPRLPAPLRPVLARARTAYLGAGARDGGAGGLHAAQAEACAGRMADAVRDLGADVLAEGAPEVEFLPGVAARMPRKRVAAGVLLRDRRGRVLLVEPRYKPTWDIPGGVVEAGESPLDGCRREVAEELGTAPGPGPAPDVTPHRLLVVDWVPRHGVWHDAVAFVFDAGRLDDAQAARLVPADAELAAVRFVDLDDAAGRLRPSLLRRLRAAVEVADGARPGPAYLEFGRRALPD